MAEMEKSGVTLDQPPFMVLSPKTPGVGFVRDMTQ